MADNPGITHNAHLGGVNRSVQTYVETGWIRLDLNGVGGATDVIQLGDDDARRLAAIITAAIVDREAS